jgi:RNA polymerase sigma-70 factor (ECF subfamily)
MTAGESAGRSASAARAPDPEAVLLRRVAGRDEHAFAMLYRSYQRRLFGYLNRMIGEPTRAEEVVDDVMVDVWKGAAGFRGESRVSSWIFGIAHHKALNVLRRRPAPFVAEVDPDVPDPGEPLDAAISREDLRRRLAVALTALTPAHREVLELTLTEGFSVQEIAAIVGIPEGTVKTRMFHARRALRARLTGQGLSAESL